MSKYVKCSFHFITLSLFADNEEFNSTAASAHHQDKAEFTDQNR